MNRPADSPLRLLLRHHRMPMSIAALCVFFIASLWLSLWFQLSNERQQMIAAAQQQTDNLARLYEEHVLRRLAPASVTLRQLETEYKRQGASLDLAQYLRDRQPELEPYTILSVVDQEGNLLMNYSAASYGVSKSQRLEEFQAQQAAGNMTPSD